VEKYYNIDTLNDRLAGLYQELLAGKLSWTIIMKKWKSW